MSDQITDEQKCFSEYFFRILVGLQQLSASSILSQKRLKPSILSKSQIIRQIWEYIEVVLFRRKNLSAFYLG